MINKCGECSHCCDIPIIKELKKKAFNLCNHYCNGCTIYEKRPDECRNFECAFLQMEKVNIALRPDKCGVMFEMLSDNIFLGTLHPDYEFSDVAKGQINAFMKQGYSVVLSRKDEKLKIYISPKHNGEDILNEFNKIYNEEWQHQIT